MFTRASKNAVWALTQSGRDAEERYAGAGNKGAVLTSLVECNGATTVDRLVGETGIDRNRLNNILEALRANGYVISQG